MSSTIPEAHSPTEAPKRRRTRRTVVLSVLGTLLALAILLLIGFFWVRSTSIKYDVEDATNECRELIERKAKYPGAVSFPDGLEVTTEDNWLANKRTYSAGGDVDFANGFGVPVRGTYYCNVVIGDVGEIVHSGADVIGIDK